MSAKGTGSPLPGEGVTQRPPRSHLRKVYRRLERLAATEPPEL
jgi:hypothetical protein